MSSHPFARCSMCDRKEWTCVGCKGEILIGEWFKHFTTSVSMYCDCCDHKFVCTGCYVTRPRNFVSWSMKFGRCHNVVDVATGETTVNKVINDVKTYLSKKSKENNS